MGWRSSWACPICTWQGAHLRSTAHCILFTLFLTQLCILDRPYTGSVLALLITGWFLYRLTASLPHPEAANERKKASASQKQARKAQKQAAAAQDEVTALRQQLEALQSQLQQSQE